MGTDTLPVLDPILIGLTLGLGGAMLKVTTCTVVTTVTLMVFNHLSRDSVTSTTRLRSFGTLTGGTLMTVWGTDPATIIIGTVTAAADTFQFTDRTVREFTVFSHWF